MANHEKTAWIMMVVLLIASGKLLQTIIQHSETLGTLVPPNAGILIQYVIALVVLSIIGHIALAITSKQALEKKDERERQFEVYGSHISGLVLGLGCVTALGHYLVHFDGSLLFYSVFAALIASQITEYLVVIWRHRRG
ncbi:hypothetical protein FM042_03335 [Aliidiomarina halalkaliphila]|uniref:Uncharacterized protein n=1 Tax=Aliidiomarina halalkaliphila TaxID=2593535 RepID=A0A552X4E2_9GAMM|nr:hypothetical protein [Aliidiomarina halalkaliphila]TRW49898.1 hypothetical protein FM042_03335 [Aliidiomarina halalkaliphila]